MAAIDYTNSPSRNPSESPLGGLDPTPLSKRKAKRVGKRGRRNRGDAAPFDMGAYLTGQQANQQQGMQAILEAYGKSQQRQPMIRRGLGGEIVDQNKQPEGMDFFKKNNPFTEESQQRQRNVNAQNTYQRNLGVIEGRNAVEAKKSEQAAMGTADANQVPSKTINGQKFVFDKQGNVVGMTGDTGVGQKLANQSLATPEARAANRQGMESAFLSQMTKGQDKQFTGGPMNQTQFTSGPQESDMYKLPTLPPGVPGQLNEAVSGNSPLSGYPPKPPGPAGEWDTPPPYMQGQGATTNSNLPDFSEVGKLFKSIGGAASDALQPKPGQNTSPGYTGGRFDIPSQSSADASGAASFLNQIGGAAAAIPGQVGQAVDFLGSRTSGPGGLDMPSFEMPNMPYQRNRQIDPNNPNQYQEIPNWWDNIISATKTGSVPVPYQGAKNAADFLLNLGY